MIIEKIVESIRINIRTNVPKSDAKIDLITDTFRRMSEIVNNNIKITKKEYTAIRKLVADVITDYYNNKIGEPFVFNSKVVLSKEGHRFVANVYDNQCGVFTPKKLAKTIKQYKFDVNNPNNKDQSLFLELTTFLDLFIPVSIDLAKILYLQEEKKIPKKITR